MPCESCGVQFSVFKRKRVCCECERFYCSSCLRRGGGAMCAPCRVLSTRPLYRNTIAHLKVRDLQCFLQRQNVSTRGCVEKDELVNLCVSHVNSATYRRRGARNAGAFSSLKGLTNNINDFINNAFDLRPPPAHAASSARAPAPAPPRAHTNEQAQPFAGNQGHRAAAGAQSSPPPQRPPPREWFSPTPGGEPYLEVRMYSRTEYSVSRSPSGSSVRVDTTDCFEVEDLDDAGWEFVQRPPADPLPNDSDVLLSTPDFVPPATGPSQPDHATTRHSTGQNQPDNARHSTAPTLPDFVRNSTAPSQSDLARHSTGPSQPDFMRHSTGPSQPDFGRHSTGPNQPDFMRHSTGPSQHDFIRRSTGPYPPDFSRYSTGPHQADNAGTTGPRQANHERHSTGPGPPPDQAAHEPPHHPATARAHLAPGVPTGARASSELELRSAGRAGPDADRSGPDADSRSLHDELPARDQRPPDASPRGVRLEDVRSPAALEALNVKQLKELLARNRVEFRGCLERADLLQRAHMLWRDHAHYNNEIDNLPIEECCKICMAAPLECVLLECGHIAACTACAKQLAECPICRQYVVRAVRFFRS